MYVMSSIAVLASSCRLGNVTCNRCRTCGTVNAADFFSHPAALADQEVMRQQRHRHMVLPAAPRAHLIVIHSHFTLAFLNCCLHRPASAALLHQCAVWRRGRSIAK